MKLACVNVNWCGSPRVRRNRDSVYKVRVFVSGPQLASPRPRLPCLPRTLNLSDLLYRQVNKLTLWRSLQVRMVNKLARTSKNGSLLFEPEIVYRIHLC